MLTTIVPNQISNLLINTNPALPAYIAVGTATTAEARSDTDLGSEIYRKAATGESELNVVKLTGTLLSVNSSAYADLTENGFFDDASSGNLYDRNTHEAVTHSIAQDTSFIKFWGVNPSSNSINQCLTNVGVNYVAGWLAGTTFTEPTHIAFGSLLILDQCDSLGTGGNAWTKSTYAGTAVLNTANYEEGIASIDLGKLTGGTAAYYYRTLAAGIDITDMSQFWIWLNIGSAATLAKLASSNCLRIRFGNDSSNYYEYAYDSADLGVGWQRLKFDLADMSETGSVTDTAIDYLEIDFETLLTTDTITVGEIIMDYWGFFKAPERTDTELIQEIGREAMESGYPQKSGNRAIYNVTVAKADGNTYTYNFVGLFNAASNGDLFFESYNYDIVKDSSTQFTEEIHLTSTLRDL